MIGFGVKPEHFFRDLSKTEEERKLRVFIAALVALSVLYFWDKEYNNGLLFVGLESMWRSIARSMFH